MCRSSLGLRSIALVAILAALLAPTCVAEEVVRVESVGMTVSDLNREVAFYTGVLSFEKLSETELEGPELETLEGVFGAHVRVARLRLGHETLELTEYLAPSGHPIPADSRSNDRWFQHVALIVSDMDRAYAVLRAHHVEHASSAPQRLPDWNPKAGGIRAFYFKDPDGHPLEILEFPPGKGDPRWQAKDGRLFLGIDHTAVVVSDTDTSLRFWRDVLGFAVVGESENWGTEQEHLNNVFGAHLRITTLRAPAGPGVELLEYLSPRDGRPRPRNARANDLIEWQTSIVAQEAPKLLGTLREAHAPLASSGLVLLPTLRLGFARGVLVSDPDGHCVRVIDGSNEEAE
jgi:catechol 2,3-dioxygenase-like lactoylglutathione lyase family enzyme